MYTVSLIYLERGLYYENKLLSHKIEILEWPSNLPSCSPYLNIVDPNMNLGQVL